MGKEVSLKTIAIWAFVFALIFVAASYIPNPYFRTFSLIFAPLTFLISLVTGIIYFQRKDTAPTGGNMPAKTHWSFIIMVLAFIFPVIVLFAGPTFFSDNPLAGWLGLSPFGGFSLYIFLSYVVSLISASTFLIKNRYAKSVFWYLALFVAILSILLPILIFYGFAAGLRSFGNMIG